MTNSKLIVFCKFPETGLVKTRLCPPLSLEQAKTLYTAFLLDSIENYLQLGVDLEICVDKKSNIDKIKNLVENEIKNIDNANILDKKLITIDYSSQVGNSLGSRMIYALESAINKGYTKAGIIGSDHPNLPNKYILKAFKSLKNNEICFGKAIDGGYYYVGINNNFLKNNLKIILHDNMPYSTNMLLIKTIEICNILNVKYAISDTWYDIDELLDLKILKHNLKYQIPNSRTKQAFAEVEHLIN